MGLKLDALKMAMENFHVIEVHVNDGEGRFDHTEYSALSYGRVTGVYGVFSVLVIPMIITIPVMIYDLKRLITRYQECKEKLEQARVTGQVVNRELSSFRVDTTQEVYDSTLTFQRVMTPARHPTTLSQIAQLDETTVRNALDYYDRKYAFQNSDAEDEGAPLISVNSVPTYEEDQHIQALRARLKLLNSQEDLPPAYQV